MVASNDENVEGNGQEQQVETTAEEDDSQQRNYSRHSFHRIASFGGFPRFQPFVMSTSSPAACTEDANNYEESTSELSLVKMSHSVLEYRSSRYRSFTL